MSRATFVDRAWNAVIFLSHACALFISARAAWLGALSGDAVAVGLNVAATVGWGGFLGAAYFEIYHGPFDRVAARRWRRRKPNDARC